MPARLSLQPVLTVHVHNQRLVARLDAEIADAAQAPRRCTDMSILIHPPAARPSPSHAVQRPRASPKRQQMPRFPNKTAVLMALAKARSSRRFLPPSSLPYSFEEQRLITARGAARHLCTDTHCVAAHAHTHTISPSTEHLSESTKNANDREELEFSAGQPNPARPRLERQSRGCPARTPSRGRGRG